MWPFQIHNVRPQQNNPVERVIAIDGRSWISMMLRPCITLRDAPSNYGKPHLRTFESLDPLQSSNNTG